MRVRMLVLLAIGLACGATTLRAQRAPRSTKAEEDPVGTRSAASAATARRTVATEEDPWYAVAVTPGRLDVLMPLLTAESGGTGTPLDKLAQVGMNKSEYTAFRRSLMIARLDAQQPARLQGLTGTQLQIRQSNVNVYNGNRARLDAVLTKLEPEPGCALCTPGATTTIIRR